MPDPAARPVTFIVSHVVGHEGTTASAIGSAHQALEPQRAEALEPQPAEVSVWNFPRLRRTSIVGSLMAADDLLFIRSVRLGRPVVDPMPVYSAAGMSDLGLSGSATTLGVTGVFGPATALRHNQSWDRAQRILERWRVANDDPSLWLAEALDELHEVADEADEEGYPHPSELASRSVSQIVRGLAARGLSTPPSILPTPEGEVAIHGVNRERMASVLIVCEPDGSVAWFSTTRGATQRARHRDAATLPDEALVAAWRSLELQ